MGAESRAGWNSGMENRKSRAVGIRPGESEEQRKGDQQWGGQGYRREVGSAQTICLGSRAFY